MAQRDKRIHDSLKEIYYSAEDPGSYGGVDRLFKRAKEKGIEGITRKLVQNFLRDQRSYSLHKPSRHNFKRNKTLVGGIDVQWQADLADMQGLSRQNAGVHYLLTCIDVFSKFAWVIPTKDKSAKEMAVAFKKLFAEAAPRKPERLQTDRGKEFLNKDVKALLKDKGVELFQTFSDKKAAVVERFNRTLKTRIWTYFSATETKRYIDVLPEIVTAYNNSYHRSIGMPPALVRTADENRIWLRLYGDTTKPLPRPKMAPGEIVRMSKVKGDFEKGYLPNWTEQHFKVEGTAGKRRRVYKLQNIRGEPINGEFYQEEVQPIRENEFRVERIIKRRKLADGTGEALVKWKGWPEKFNTWVTTDGSGRPVPGGAPQ